MLIERLLQILVAMLVVLGTTLSGLGQQKAFVAIAAPIVAVSSLYFTDISERVRLGNTLGSILGLGALLYSSQDLLNADNHVKWLTMVNLLAVFQFVLLFQEKTTRTYWQLIVLSFGQVAAASALSGGVSFGFLLLAYMFLGILSLALLLVHREMLPFDRQTRSDRPADPAAPPEPGSFQAGSLPAGALSTGPRWPLRGAAVQLTGARADVPAIELAGSLLSHSALILAGSLGVACIVFFLLPRSGRKWDQPTSASGAPQFVGFSKTVNLGQLGDFSESRDLVLRAQFFYGSQETPFRLENDPLFRGTVVTNYRRGRWTQDVVGEAVPLPVGKPPAYVRQQYVIEPMQEPVLFALYPVFSLRHDPCVRFDLAYKELVRQNDLKSRRFEYELGTTGIREGAQLPIIPSTRPLRRWEEQFLLQMPQSDAANGLDPLAGLRRAAETALAKASVDPGERYATARALEAYLRDSGLFSYNVHPPARNEKLDPLEDFVVEHPAGHCEFFAGALAMMLRSQGIPSRVVIGFRGSEWNDAGKYYQVRQSNAHTWVEAYLRPTDRVPEKLAQYVDTSRGAWLTLDPTAAIALNAGTVASRNEKSLSSTLAGLSDYAFVLWMKYVVELSPDTQQTAIYGPLAAVWNAVRHGIFDSQAWRGLGETVAGWFRQNWFSGQGALAGSALCLLAVGIYRLLGIVLRPLWRHVVAPTARAVLARSPAHEFHRRLEKALAQRGLTRSPGQTALEFAVAAGGELAESVECRRYAPLPRRVVEALYRVRFGGRSLDPTEAEAVEHALVDLEQGLAIGKQATGKH
jgi:transglutaminase-like putative cysteine protease